MNNVKPHAGADGLADAGHRASSAASSEHSPVLPMTGHELFEAVANSASLALCLLDARGHCVYLNPAAVRLTGFTLAELEGRTLHESIHPSRADGTPSPHAECTLCALQAADAAREGEDEFLRRDGRRYRAAYKLSSLRDARGRLAGGVLELAELGDLGRDQPALGESPEQELRERYEQQSRLFESIASTTPDFIYIFDLEARFLYANRRLLEVWGKTFDEALGKKLHELGYPDWHAKMHEQEIAHVIRTRASIRGEVPFTGGSGISGVYEYIFTPVLGPDGEVEIIAGTTRDVTARKQSEEAERRARADAEQASQLKDEFLATLSHELRTPLNAILGWSQILLRRGQGDEKTREGLTIIERNARVQAQLIEDLLDMSRIIAGKLRLDVQSIDLTEVINTSLESVAPAAEAKNVRIETVVDASARTTRGDTARLQQIVWNLLSNAIKFTPTGGAIVIALERAGSHVELSVTDTGIGIAPEFLPHVFERFRQSDGASTRRHQGLGLGLGIVKSLVELHGGQVRAESPGLQHGARFIVELPLLVLQESERIDREHAVAAIPRESGPELEEGLLEGVYVLVVDDESDARELVRHLIEECRGRVVTASDASEAFELLQRERPHVLLSDIGMPGEDGLSLIRRIRELPARDGGDTPAVALTAFARWEDRRQALVSGFQAHLAKPVEPAELVTVIASVAGVMRRSSGIEPKRG